MNTNSGFTLIELLVVVTIIGVLAAISIANFDEYKRRANDTVALNQLMEARTATEAYIADNGEFTNLQSIVIEGNGTVTSIPGGFTLATVLPGYTHTRNVELGVSYYYHPDGFARIIGSGYCKGTAASADTGYSDNVGAYEWRSHEYDGKILRSGFTNFPLDGSGCI